MTRLGGGRHVGLSVALVAATLTVARSSPERLLGSPQGSVPTHTEEAPLVPIQLSPAEEARARGLEGELRCPVCRSQSIRQSRSFMAEDMKRRIRVLIAEGRTDEEIREHFLERYGQWILLTPPARGFSLTAYLLPGVAVVVGALGLAIAARRWRRSSSRRPPVEPPAESPYLARLERELEETE